MKLIRLTSTENKAMFDNTFNDPISLPANAQVALANVALASEPRSVAIDANNGVVTWTTESSDGIISYENTLTMDAGVYNAGTQQTFMDNLEGDLNDNQETSSHLVADQISYGLMVNTQWTVVENTGNPDIPGQTAKTVDDKKIVIGYRKACTSWDAKEPGVTPAVSPLVKDFVSLNTTIDTTGQYNMVNRATGNGDEESYLMAHQPMTWGPGGFAFNLNTIAKDTGPASTVQGVFMGLTTINHATSKPTTKPTRAECKFGIHCPYADGSEPYVIYKSGVATTTNAIIAAGDSVLINRSKGTLTGYVNDDFLDIDNWTELQDTSDEDVTLDWKYRDNASAPLYPVVIFYGANDDTVIEQLSYAPDPYKYFTWRQGKNQESDCLWDLFPLSPENRRINFKMQISEDVAEYLGFQSGGLGDFKFPARPANLQLVSSTSFGWKAVRSWATVGISESFYVQLLSAGCEGYDGLTSGRKNILAVIPKSDDSNLLLYDVANPLFLEIGNAFPITLRNISARVLTEDGGELPTDGLSVMTLLFK